MTVNDFCTRWMYHYINEDFLKIPTKDNKYIRLQLGLGTYWLKQGGYGTYDKENFNFAGISGFLFYKNGKNKIYYITSDGQYVLSEQLKSNIQIAYQYKDKLSSSSQFYINKSGIYYFLPYYESGGICSLSASGTATAFINNEQINYNIFQGAPCYQFFISDESIYRYGKKKSEAPIVKNILCYYYEPWEAYQHLPDIRENYTGTYRLSREWVTTEGDSNVDTADLWATEVYKSDGSKATSFNDALHSYDSDYKNKNFSITLTINPYDFEYVKQLRTSRDPQVQYDIHYNSLSDKIIWNHTIEEGEVEGYYKTHYCYFDIIYSEVFSLGWQHRYGVGDGKSYIKQNFTESAKRESIALADITVYEANVLQVDRNLRVKKVPTKINESFEGWVIDNYYYQHSYYGTWQNLRDTNYKYYQTLYNYDQIISNQSGPVSINDNYTGLLFTFDGVNYITNRTLGGPASVKNTTSPSSVLYFSAPQILDGFYRYSGGSDVRLYTFVGDQFNLGFPVCPHGRVLPPVYTTSWGESAYWHNLNSGYCAFKKESISRNKLPGVYYDNISYVIWCKKDVDYSNVENWTTENLIPEISLEERKKITWKMEDYIQRTPIPDSFSWTVMDPNKILQNWDNLSQELQEYLGVLHIYCMEDALNYCVNNMLIEDELGKMLKTYPDPSEIL